MNNYSDQGRNFTVNGGGINTQQQSITSIVDDLQNGNLYRVCNQNQLLYDDVIQRLDHLLYWLDNEAIPPIYFILNEIKCYDYKAMHNCQLKMKAIKKKFKDLNKFFNICKARHSRSNSMFLCSSCNHTIPFSINSNINLWGLFQSHEHIENNLAGICNSQDGMNICAIQEMSDELEDEPILENEILESKDVSELKDEWKVQLSVTELDNENCWKCGSEYIKNFKFNFAISYHSVIENTFYFKSKSFMHDIDGLHTIQVKGPQLFACLLCSCDVPITVTPKTIFVHSNGQKHNKKKSCSVSKGSLSMYHSNWLKLEMGYQSHQVYFLPMDYFTVMCNLCNCLVEYTKLPEHIDSNLHKSAFFKISYGAGKIYLTKIQASVYCTEDIAENNLDASNAIGKQQIRSNQRILANIDKEESVSDDSDENSTSADRSKANEGPNLKSDNGSQDKSKKATPHIVVKSVFNPQATEFEDLLENRFLVHLDFFKKVEGDRVECNCCQEIIPKQIPSIREHVLTDVHVKKSGIPRVKYNFHCEMCNFKYKDDEQWRNHLKDKGHIERLNRLGESRRKKIIEYECNDCKLIFCGDELSVKRHQAAVLSKHIRSARKKAFVLPDQVKLLFKSVQVINELSAKLAAEAKEVLVNQEPMLFCCFALESALSEVFPCSKAYPFGSRVSGLGNKDSDLDVFIDTGDMYTGLKNQDSKTQEKFVKSANRVFRMKRNEFDHVNPIPTARTPIVQVYHIQSRIDCDISFRHGLSVENTKFLRLCIEVQPITQPLILILKKWLMKCKLYEHITTYALSMVVIFFLQTKGHFIGVQELKQLYSENLLDIDGWKVPDFSKPQLALWTCVVRYEGSVKQLLIEFFEYYKDFNYANDVICPLIGCPVKKSLFSEKPQGEALPLEMLTYVQKIIANPNMEMFRSLSSLCIQDPFDLSHNLTKACSQSVTDKFKAMCKLTFLHLHTIH